MGIEYETLDCADESTGSCGATKQITLRGEAARCAQHEMDHDKGILIVDHVALDDLLAVDGTPFMAQIEDADGLHARQRMQRAYAREVSDSTLIPSDEKFVQLAMEDSSGYHARVEQIENQRADNLGQRPWFVQPANAIGQEDGTSLRPAATSAPRSNVKNGPSRPMTDANNPTCNEDCLAERKRTIEQRRAMMQQARSNTQRADVLKLSEQRAGLYGAEFGGLPARYCSRPGFCP